MSNNQLVPVKSFSFVIDSLSRQVFDADLKAKNSLSGKALESKRKNIASEYTITNMTCNDLDLDEFDRAVLDAAIAEQLAGNDITTTERIYRRLGGKRCRTNAIIDAINDSVERLAGVRVTVEMQAAIDALNYKDSMGRSTFRGYLLPTESLTATVNGQDTTAIRFLSKGVAYTVAELKNQIMTCDSGLLDIPVRSTRRTIALKHYCLRRVLEISNSRKRYLSNKRVTPLKQSISFSDLLDKCGLKEITRRQRQQVKYTISVIFDVLTDRHIIRSWHFAFSTNGEILSIVIEC